MTAPGAYLKATALRRRARIEPDDHARAVFDRAFRLAAPQRFPDGTPLTEIAVAVDRVAAANRAVGVPRREAEMLIRDALGETVPVSGIGADHAMTVHVLFFAAFADDLALTDDEVDDLITRAEVAATR